MFDGLSEVVADELFDEDTNLDLSDEEEGTDNSDAYSYSNLHIKSRCAL